MWRSKQKDKNKEGWGIRTPADVMSHTFEPHVHSWLSVTNTNGQKATHAYSVCLKGAAFAHTSTDKVRCLDTRLTSLCVQQTNHPQHMHRGKGVAVESGVIYRLTSSERGRRRDGEQVKAKEKEEREQGQRRGVSWLGKWATWFPPFHSHRNT